MRFERDFVLFVLLGIFGPFVVMAINFGLVRSIAGTHRLGTLPAIVFLVVSNGTSIGLGILGLWYLIKRPKLRLVVTVFYIPVMFVLLGVYQIVLSCSVFNRCM